MEGADSPPVTPDGRGRNERGLLTPARAVLHSEIRGVPALPEMATAGAADGNAPPPPPGDGDGAARAAANLAANVDMLGNDGLVGAAVALQLARLQRTCTSQSFMFQLGRRSIETLFTIDDDDEDEETAAHATAHGRFDGILSLLSSDDFTSHLDKYIFVQLIGHSIEQKSTAKHIERWAELIDVNTTLGVLMFDDRFAKLNLAIRDASLSTLATTATAAAPVAAAMKVTSHRPELPKLKNVHLESNSATHRQLRTMATEADDNMTHGALVKALEDVPKYQEAWTGFLDRVALRPGRDAKTMAGQVKNVREFLEAEMNALHPSEFAKDDEALALAMSQAVDESADDYVTRAARLIMRAEQSHKGTDRVLAAALSTEAEQCKLVVKGLQPKTKAAVENHIKSKEHIFHEKGERPPGYVSEGFSLWSVMEKAIMIEGRAFNPKDKAGGETRRKSESDEKGGDKEKSKWSWTKNQESKLKQLRALAVADAASKGLTVTCGPWVGVAMMLEEGLKDSGGKVHSPPAAEVAAVMDNPTNLPPYLINPDGSKAQGICRWAWQGKPCRRGDKCTFNHDWSKESFDKAVREGKTALRTVDPKQGAFAAQDSAPAAAAAASPPAPSPAEPSIASALHELTAQLKHLNVNQASSQRLLVDLNSKLDTADPAAAKALADRKAHHAVKSAAVQRDELRDRLMQQRAEAMHAHELLESKLQALELEDSGPAPSAPSFGAPPGVSLVSSKALEEHWDSPSVRKGAQQMLHAALATATKALEAPSRLLTSGQPIIVLKSGRCFIRCMVDTGCSPMGLCSMETYRVLKELGAKGIGELIKFDRPKPLSGIENADDAVAVTHAFRMEAIEPKSQRIVVAYIGVMVNGSTGLADMLIGGYHMRATWKSSFSEGMQEFVIHNPDDGMGGEISIPVEWEKTSAKPLLSSLFREGSSVRVAHHSTPVFTVAPDPNSEAAAAADAGAAVDSAVSAGASSEGCEESKHGDDKSKHVQWADWLASPLCFAVSGDDARRELDSKPSSYAPSVAFGSGEKDAFKQWARSRPEAELLAAESSAGLRPGDATTARGKGSARGRGRGRQGRGGTRPTQE